MSPLLGRDAALLALSPDNPAPLKRTEPTVAGPAWRPTRAFGIAVAFVAAALLAAVTLGRPDLVLVASPLAVGTTWSLTRRPRRLPRATITRDDEGTPEGGRVTATIVVTNPDDVEIASLVEARVSRWIGLRHGVGRYADRVRSGHDTIVRLEGDANRWGIHAVGPVRVVATACDGLLRSVALRLKPVSVKVFPTAEPFDSRQPLPMASGMAGIHRSRRPGDGGELAEVRQFRAGDRLRRIDWRVSLRQRELYVNATLSERDADVVVLMDVLHEAGESGGVSGAASVMDATVRAAAAIVEHYVHQGDRVSVVEFGPRLRRLRPGTGRRHYLSALEWLLDTRVLPGGVATAQRMTMAAAQAPGALIVMLTPLIDERSTQGLALLARSGRKLVTVDTLADDVRPPDRGDWSDAAARLWLLERDSTIADLRELGVPVAQWRGTGSLDLMLSDVSRLTRAPKVGMR